MLLDLTVGNFRSVYEPASINMLATKEQVHRARCPELKRRYSKRVNPVAALFGANAAGKSTFVRALIVLRHIVTDPPRPSESMPYDPFKLLPEADTEPTSFEILFSVNDVIYEYILRYDAHGVVAERLTQYRSRDEVDIFERSGNELSFPLLDKKESAHPTEVAQARALLESVPEKVPLASFASEANLSRFPQALRLDLFDVVRVFLQTVLVIPAGIIDSDNTMSFSEGWKEVITQIDAGITGVQTETVPLSSLGMSAERGKRLDQLLRQYPGTAIDVELPAGRFTVRLEDGEMSAERISLLHSSGAGESRALKWRDESDGTQSAARLLGFFSRLAFADAEAVFVVDELDRSFHTELSRALIGGFLANSNENSRVQLLFTTHDLLLMDPELLRRDEIWVIEKDRFGQTQSSVLSDFKGPRKVTDLRKSYLNGRFGGVPSIKPLEFPDEQ